MKLLGIFLILALILICHAHAHGKAGKGKGKGSHSKESHSKEFSGERGGKGSHSKESHSKEHSGKGKHGKKDSHERRSISKESYSKEQSDEKDGDKTVRTGSNYKYHILSGVRTRELSCFQFRVAACHDVHIALVDTPKQIKKSYEIVIGGWRNRKSVIRKETQGVPKATFAGGLLNCKDFRPFWISWHRGLIVVGRGVSCGEQVLMSWKDTHPYKVNLIGISTGFGAIGVWRIGSGTQQQIINLIPSKASYVGCFEDKRHRLLGDAHQSNHRLTVDFCVAYCQAKNKRYAGVENRRSCFCGDALKNYPKRPDKDCAHSCFGNHKQMCGGAWRIAVFQLKCGDIYCATNARCVGGKCVCERGYHGDGSKECKKDVMSLQVARVPTATYVGCYEDRKSRILDPHLYRMSQLTAALCVEFCQKRKKAYAGLEFTNVCFCGNSMKNYPQKDEKECSMPCAGNIKEKCGGSWRINIYKLIQKTTDLKVQHVPRGQQDTQVPKSTYIGCYEDRQSRILDPHVYSMSKLTTASCIDHCQKRGKMYAGVEYRRQCFCGNSMKKYPKKNEKECSMPCAGNSKERCGGSWRINIYKLIQKRASPIVSQVPKVAQVPHTLYLGCFEDRSPRLLDPRFMRITPLSAARCVDICRRRGQMYAGLEYGNECFCGDTMRNYPKKDEKECSMPCSRNTKEICGASMRINVFQITCGGKSCAKNGRCVDGRCVCKRGYHGDGYKSCTKSCFCMASGDPHYKTFDGEMIHFMGTCKYTLSKSLAPNDPCSFHVTVKNEHRHKKTHVSYTRLVDLQILGKTISLRQKGEVMLDGERKYLPMNVLDGKIKIFRSGRYTQVWTNCGIQVNYDGNHAVALTVPGQYRGNLTGLCGDCNGKRDDMKTKEGKNVRQDKNRYSLIGNSYEVTDDTGDQEQCTTEDQDTFSSFSCDAKTSRLLSTDKYCGFLQNKRGPFAVCIAQFPETAKEFFESCRIDVCSMKNDMAALHESKCESVEAFAEECADNGVNVKWRTASFCPYKCTDPDAYYFPSGPACPASCLKPDEQKDCALEPREGCFCKDGFVMSEEKCIPKSECGCKDHQGNYFPIGAFRRSSDCTDSYECKRVGGKATLVKIPSPSCHKDARCGLDKSGEKKCICKKGYSGDGYKSCQIACGGKTCTKNGRCLDGRCVCNRGYHGDGYKSCTKSCFCMASGDPHYKTFDGEMIHFMGTCKYTLSKSLLTNDPCSFHVTVKNEHRHKKTHVSYTRLVDLQILGKTISLRQKGEVMLDGEKKYLPLNILDGKIKVFRSGRYTQVWTNCGVQVNYDGNHAVALTVPGQYRGNLTGLCGDCNGKRDDMKTKEGNDVRQNKNRYSLIGNSYEVTDNTGDQKQCSTQEEDPFSSFSCDAKTSRLLSTDNYCGFLQNKRGPFAACIAQFPETAKEFFGSCRIDVCSMKNDLAALQESKCESVEAFAEECADNGVNVKWRTTSFCPYKCKDPNAHYLPTGPACPASCLKPDGQKDCALEPREGCFCKDGFVMSDKECIPKSECGCKDQQGNYFPIGSFRRSSDCTGSYQCKRVGGKATLVKVPSAACHKEARCGLDRSGEKRCICKKGYSGDGYKNCQQTCDGKLCADNGICRKGKCVCKRGFHGDGYNVCDKSCFCMASGDPHYKTFDGEMIHFMGNCKYTLTRSLVPNDPCSFHISVKNEHRGKNTRVSYTRRVDIQILGKTISLRQKGEVTVDGERKYLPSSISDGKIKIFGSGRYTQVWTTCDVKVNFDGKHAVAVTVPGKYRGQLIGLCGDCNGKRDDMKTKDGKDVRSEKKRYSLIGNSYQVSDDTEIPGNICTAEGEDTPFFSCDAKTTNLLPTENYCGLIQNRTGPFSTCIAQNLDVAKEFFESCRIDVCSKADDSEWQKESICQSVESFAEECAYNGFEVKWRRPQFCPFKCEDPHAEYLPSGPACPPSCLDPDGLDNCVLEAREGCFCKEGYVMSDGKCVHRSECGCRDDTGDYFPIGSFRRSSDCGDTHECKRVGGKATFVLVLSGSKCHKNAVCGLDESGEKRCKCKKGFYGDGYKRCQPLCRGKYRCHKNAHCKKGRKCICNNGYFGDGQNSCDKMCTCTASGDPHYRTYDGQMIHFMGVCKYTLSKSLMKNDSCSFNVEVKNEHRGRNRRVAYTRSVDIHVFGKTIRLGKKHTVYINGVKKYLPVVEDDAFKIFLSGRFVQVLTKCNVRLAWDGKSVVQVGVPDRYKNHMEGICGNCNGKRDDYRTKDGRDVSKQKTVFVQIGQSYEVRDDSDDPHGICRTEENDVRCTPEMTKFAEKKHICGLLDARRKNSSPFKACLTHKPMLASQMYNLCKYDVCSYFDDTIKRTEAACRAAEGLETICENSGYEITWRSPEFCPLTCGPNQRYSQAMSGCPATCTSPNSEETCTLPETEGCECLPGYVLSGTQCVKETECGCQDINGDYIPLGTLLVSDDCTSTKRCVRRDGISVFEMLAVNERCHQNGMCGMIEGVRQCICKEGYTGDGIKQCDKLCGGKYKCHKLARCEDGICQCNNGLFGDGINSCQETCTCIASGDPHYRTFDGQMIHFMGDCKYTLSELDTADRCGFTVQVKNIKRHHKSAVSFTRLVDVKIAGADIRLHQGKRLTINGYLMYTPYTPSNNLFSVTLKGRFITVTTSCGAVISFDGVHSVSVTVPRVFGARMTGICGNCNGQKDDLKTKSGKDVSSAKNKFAKIGDSYRVYDDLASGHERCAVEDSNFKCTSIWVKKAVSLQYCGILLDKSGPFAKCIAADEELANQLYKTCVDDVCAYEKIPGVAEKTACMAAESFAEMCLTKGFGKAVWRSSDFCPLQCPANSVYNPAIIGCPRTCSDVDGVGDCDAVQQEGCECIEGYVLSGEKCVRQTNCGCFFKNNYFPLNAPGPLSNCDIIQTCIKDGGINRMVARERNLHCHQNAECSHEYGSFQCKCKRGYEGDGINQCIAKTEPQDSPPVVTKPPLSRKGKLCKVTTTHNTCGSTIRLAGDCEYSSNILSKCQYSIVTSTVESGNYVAFLTTKGRRSLLRKGQKVDECVEVINDGSTIIISDDVCQRCTAELLKNLIPKDTCPGP